LEFRIEVFERSDADISGSRFRVRVWLRELVRLSSLPVGDAEPGQFDNSVLTLSDMFDPMEFGVETPDEAAEVCIATIRDRLTGHRSGWKKSLGCRFG
jgi:hypothetical protein